MSLKILIAVKRVVDYTVKVRVLAGGQGVDTANVKMSMNPFDEIAVEEAVRLKEAGQCHEIVLVSIGSATSQETLRAGLAMGADRGLLLQTDKNLEPLLVAKLLRSVVMEEKPDLILLGKQAIDGDDNQVGQLLAGFLEWPQATFASKIVVEPDRLVVTREVDGGLETLALPKPCVITTDLRLNQPRFTTLPNIMKAKQKPLAIKEAESLGVDLTPHVDYLKFAIPEARKAGVRVQSVAELVEKLKFEAKVLP